MAVSQPTPILRFVGAAITAVGVLVMTLCGGCGATFFAIFLLDLTRPSGGEPGVLLMPLVFGGLPALLGFGVVLVGRSLVRYAERPAGPGRTDNKP